MILVTKDLLLPDEPDGWLFQHRAVDISSMEVHRLG
jgi:hypothetical protein